MGACLRVFLGNPPWSKPGRLGVRAGSRWPFTMVVKAGERLPFYVPFPFYLAYAAAVLEREGHQVLLVDAIAEGITEEEFLARAADFRPDAIILETSTPTIAVDLASAKSLKQRTNARIILCGPHVTVEGARILRENKFVDFAAVGEYEFVVRDLVTALASGADASTLKGVLLRKEGVVVDTGRAEPVDINQLPWPARHFLPMLNYRDGNAGLPQPSLQLHASRGCPFRCDFCLWPQVMYNGGKYRVRDPKDVVDEIEFCLKTWGFQSFYFDDDTFDIGRDRIVRLCDEIKARNIRVPWEAMCRADTCDYAMLKAMKDAGLYCLKFGVESGNQETLKRIRKNLDLGKVRQTMRECRELGIKTHLTFTFGLTGETIEDVKKTIDFAIELDPDSVQFSLTTPFPGTDFYKNLDARGLIISTDWSKYDGNATAVFRAENLSPKQLENALAEAKRRWQAHKRFRHRIHQVKGILRLLVPPTQ